MLNNDIMTEDELIEIIEANTETHNQARAILTAAHAYSRSQHDDKPLVMRWQEIEKQKPTVGLLTVFDYGDDGYDTWVIHGAENWSFVLHKHPGAKYIQLPAIA